MEFQQTQYFENDFDSPVIGKGNNRVFSGSPAGGIQI
jgi:hypothetical protein